MTTIHVWHCGQVYVDQALAFREKLLHPAPYTGILRPKSKKNWVPVSTYLIQHQKGNILIDTGWSEEIRTSPKKHLGWFSHALFKAKLLPGQSVREQLYAIGLRPKDLDIVLLSHLHVDHVSGIKDLIDSSKFLTSAIEWKSANKDVGYNRSMWQDVPIQTFEMETIPFGPYNKGIDLFQEGTVYLVFTPGHSKGLFSVMVKTDGGWVLIVSDVAYAERSWKESIIPGITSNAEEALRSLQWVQQFSLRDDCRCILANHDPTIKPHIIT
ncbi:N-acyl homoserine lactonase family protein [Paenibacillus sp. L3-i20]|uniref:N-acyl homoserine lactonase family protein n=1 Tax=Paenibacillus sp. L3-i20 TaxID=2905833 RepID=UPI001EDF5C03|nr:N-acyl homoserine lactonase family protein [Paenibacillus sp. L3-i20]GKU80032.1 N-acyl homoserine lactonase family protein [Paenibacillus sp. L3-i20]